MNDSGILEGLGGTMLKLGIWIVCIGIGLRVIVFILSSIAGNKPKPDQRPQVAAAPKPLPVAAPKEVEPKQAAPPNNDAEKSLILKAHAHLLRDEFRDAAMVLSLHPNLQQHAKDCRQIQHSWMGGVVRANLESRLNELDPDWFLKTPEKRSVTEPQPHQNTPARNISQFEVFGRSSKPSAATAGQVCRTWVGSHPGVNPKSAHVAVNVDNSGLWTDEHVRHHYPLLHYSGSQHQWDFVSVAGEEFLLLVVFG